MEFTIPQNHQQLMDTLRDIFVYYRVKKQDFNPSEMQKISLEKLADNFRTEEQLIELATTMLKGEHEKQIFEYRQGLENQLQSVYKEIETAEKSYIDTVNALNARYGAEIEEYKLWASRNGIMKGDIYIEKVSKIKAELSELKEKANAEKENKIKSLTEKSQSLTQAIENASEYFKPMHTAEIQSKTACLIEEENKLKTEVVKYNNGVDEKNIKYSNYVEQMRSSLMLRYMEIRSEPLSKDELVNIGYYADIIDCVDGYYSTLSPQDAYNDFISDGKIGMYLEDYYQILLTHYKTKANA
jgi:hypothetical protein